MKRIVRFEGSQSEVYGCNNKAWVVATSVCSWYLGLVCFVGYSFKSPPSSRGCCSQNWVLDRRWRVLLRQLITLLIMLCRFNSVVFGV
ncbi:hypothetical protein ACFX15_001081 [Malus domestica]